MLSMEGPFAEHLDFFFNSALDPRGTIIGLEPGYKLPHAFFEWRVWPQADRLAQILYIGVRRKDVPSLHGQHVPHGLLAALEQAASDVHADKAGRTRDKFFHLFFTRQEAAMMYPCCRETALAGLYIGWTSAASTSTAQALRMRSIDMTKRKLFFLRRSRIPS
jgi:hypothetical protein